MFLLKYTQNKLCYFQLKRLNPEEKHRKGCHFDIVSCLSKNLLLTSSCQHQLCWPQLSTSFLDSEIARVGHLQGMTTFLCASVWHKAPKPTFISFLFSGIKIRWEIPCISVSLNSDWNTNDSGMEVETSLDQKYLYYQLLDLVMAICFKDSNINNLKWSWITNKNYRSFCQFLM